MPWRPGDVLLLGADRTCRSPLATFGSEICVSVLKPKCASVFFATLSPIRFGSPL